jgi:hypothetical protein
VKLLGFLAKSVRYCLEIVVFIDLVSELKLLGFLAKSVRYCLEIVDFIDSRSLGGEVVGFSPCYVSQKEPTLGSM